MRAAFLRTAKSPLVVENLTRLVAGAGDVLIELKAAALNRRDYWITQGMYPNLKLPAILGSDGAGVVQAVGSDVDPSWNEREVILFPCLNWGNDAKRQGPDFQILGMPRPGTLASHIVVPVANVFPKPSFLDWKEAAALPLAGLTAYRALTTQGQLQPEDVVLVTGAGGGVATFAIQFARASGARVIATSSSDQKLLRARELGADLTLNYRQEGWFEALRARENSPSLVIDGAGGESWRHLVDALDFGGRIVNYGATAGMPPELDLFKVFWKQLRIQGTTMGSPQDFAAMLNFVVQHHIRPALDMSYTLEDINIALQRMAEQQQIGKITVEMSKSRA